MWLLQTTFLEILQHCIFCQLEFQNGKKKQQQCKEKMDKYIGVKSGRQKYQLAIISYLRKVVKIFLAILKYRSYFQVNQGTFKKSMLMKLMINKNASVLGTWFNSQSVPTLWDYFWWPSSKMATWEHPHWLRLLARPNLSLMDNGSEFFHCNISVRSQSCQ